jgi:hypothetical protein
VPSPNPKLALRVPDDCPFCGTAGKIVLETTVKGKVVVLKWCCESCSAEWPVTPEEEQIDHRQGPDDRRVKKRNDRRKV